MTNVAVALCAALVLVQQPTFRSRTDTVALYPSVRDSANRLVTGLGKNDFVVELRGITPDVTAVPLPPALLPALAVLGGMGYVRRRRGAATA